MRGIRNSLAARRGRAQSWPSGAGSSSPGCALPLWQRQTLLRLPCCRGPRIQLTCPDYAFSALLSRARAARNTAASLRPTATQPAFASPIARGTLRPRGCHAIQLANVQQGPSAEARNAPERRDEARIDPDTRRTMRGSGVHAHARPRERSPRELSSRRRRRRARAPSARACSRSGAPPCPPPSPARRPHRAARRTARGAGRATSLDTPA